MPAVVRSQQQPTQSVDAQSSSVTSSSLSATPVALTLRRALPAGLPGFLVKLWSLVNDPTTDAVIGWDSSGDCIQINDGNTLASELLPLYFKHNNLSSFTRQLNMYGFHKQAALDSSGQMHFQHPYFRRDRPDLLASVNRHMMPPGGRFSLAVATRGVATPLARPSGTVDADFNDASSAASANAASLSFTAGADGRDAMQAALTEMRSRQSATDEQLRRLCDENHKLWLELDNLRVQHQQQQVAVTWLLDFIKAAMVNCSAQGGHGGGPIINEADLLSPGEYDSPRAASDATFDAAAPAAANTAGDCMSAFGQLNRKRQAPLMAIEMRPAQAAIEGAKRLRAITQLPQTPTTPPDEINAESTLPEAFCQESFTADLNSRQADLNGIVNALETDNSLDFDVDQLLSELAQSPAPPPPIIEPVNCAVDRSPLAAVIEGAAVDIEPPILTSRLCATSPAGSASVATISNSCSPTAAGERPSLKS